MDLKISVVIPSYNEEKYISFCLESLAHQIEQPDEIIVVDNNSTDATATIARKYGVKVVKESQQGITFARNAGFNMAKYDIIARTDADTTLPIDWIKRIKEKFAHDPELAGLSGPARFQGLSPKLQISNWPIRTFFQSFKYITKHDGLFGPNMAIRKSAWEKIKHETCDKDYLFHEDLDLAIHLGKIGKIEFDPSLLVTTSIRRWKKMKSYPNYYYRYVLTMQMHQKQIRNFGVKTKMLVSHLVLKTKEKLSPRRISHLI